MPKASKAKPLRQNLTAPRDLFSYKGVKPHLKPQGLTGTVLVGDDTGLIQYVSVRTGKIVASFGEQNPLYRINHLDWADEDQSSFLSVLSNGDVRLYDTVSGHFRTVVHREQNLLKAFTSPAAIDGERLLWTLSKDGNVRTWAMDVGYEGVDAAADDDEEEEEESSEDLEFDESSKFASSAKSMRRARRPLKRRERMRRIAESMRDVTAMKVTLNDSVADVADRHAPTTKARLRTVICPKTGKKVSARIPSEFHKKMFVKRKKRVGDHWIDDRLAEESRAHLLLASQRGSALSECNLNDILEQRRAQREFERQIREGTLSTKTSKKRSRTGAADTDVVFTYDKAKREHTSHKRVLRNDGKPFKRPYKRTKTGTVWIARNRVGIEGLTHFDGEVMCAALHPSMQREASRAPTRSPLLAIAGFNREVEIWDLCKRVRTFRALPFVDSLDIAHTQTVTQVAWCKANTRLIVSTTAEGLLRTHDVRVSTREGRTGQLKQRVSDDYSITKLHIKSKQKALIGDAAGNVFELDYLKPVAERGWAYRRYRSGVSFGAVSDFAPHPTRKLFATVGLGRYLTVHRYGVSRLPLQRVYLKTRATSVLFSDKWETIWKPEASRDKRKKDGDESEDKSKTDEFLASDNDSEDEFEADSDEEIVEMEDEAELDEEEGGSERVIASEEHDEDWDSADEANVNQLLDGYDSDDMREMLRRMENGDI